MRAVIIPVTPFAQNCSLVWCPETLEGAVIDPGGDIDRVLAEVRKHGVKLTKILLTHAHIDHAGGTAELARREGLPIIGPHEGDRFWIEGLPDQARMFGFGECETFEPDQWLDEGDRVRVGNVELQVRHCPGHTPGHVVFHSPADQLAFVGDVLFQGSIGRTDFPGGDHATLIDAIRSKLFPLGDDVRFVPGHGPMSTFGHERRTNPFVGDAAVG
jgi:hydroxyacylglutathione hydrolase